MDHEEKMLVHYDTEISQIVANRKKIEEDTLHSMLSKMEERKFEPIV